MKQINEAFNSRDVDRIMSFFAEDCTFLMARGPEPEGRRVHGKAAVRKVLADRFRVITDMRWDHVDAFITGDRAVTVWMVTGTGVDGEKLNSRGCGLYEFRGDKRGGFARWNRRDAISTSARARRSHPRARRSRCFSRRSPNALR